MSDIPECLENDHDWVWGEPYYTTGPNLLEKTVGCWGNDGICARCGDVTWKRVEGKQLFGEEKL